MSDPQVSFQEEYKFTSACVHCGNPMGSLSIDRYESIGPGRVEKRPIFKLWIDPEHECTYLKFGKKRSQPQSHEDESKRTG